MFLKSIKSDFGLQAYVEAKNWININKGIRKTTLKKEFLLKCRNYNLFPNNIINNTKNVNNISFYSRSVCKQLNSMIEKLKYQLRNMEIKDIHNHLHFLQNKSNNIRKSLASLIPTYLLDNMISYQNDLNSKIHNNKIILDKKFENLKTKQYHYVDKICLNKHKNSNNPDPWLINYSNIILPDSVSNIIRLGDKFSSSFVSSKNEHIFEIVKDLETNIHKIPEEKQDEFRHKVLSLSSKYINKPKHISDFDRSIAMKIKSTQEFLKDEKQLLVTKADKENITVVLNKSDYNKKMNDLLNDQSTYEKINSNPLSQLQKNVL